MNGPDLTWGQTLPAPESHEDSECVPGLFQPGGRGAHGGTTGPVPGEHPGECGLPKSLTQPPEPLRATDGTRGKAVDTDVLGTPLHSQMPRHCICMERRQA